MPSEQAGPEATPKYSYVEKLCDDHQTEVLLELSCGLHYKHLRWHAKTFLLSHIASKRPGYAMNLKFPLPVS
jgi:hypothetical protein